MPHGASQVWNDAVERVISPLKTTYRLEMAYGMGGPGVIQEAVSRLEARGIRRIVFVRMYTLARHLRSARTTFWAYPKLHCPMGMAIFTVEARSPLRFEARHYLRPLVGMKNRPMPRTFCMNVSWKSVASRHRKRSFSLPMGKRRMRIMPDGYR